MKYAIIINGNYRTWNQCRENFAQTFCDIDYDIFLTTYNRKFGYHPYIKGVLNYHIDEPISKEEILEGFKDLNVKGMLYEDMTLIEDFINEENNKFDVKMQNIHSSFGQYRKIEEACRLIERYEQENNFKYDRIIKTRFDLTYVPFSKNIQPNEAAITPGNCFPNDHIYILERDQFIKSNGFIMNEFYKPIYPNSHETPPHTLLLNSFLHFNLSVKTIKMTSSLIRVNQVQQF